MRKKVAILFAIVIVLLCLFSCSENKGTITIDDVSSKEDILTTETITETTEKTTSFETTEHMTTTSGFQDDTGNVTGITESVSDTTDETISDTTISIVTETTEEIVSDTTMETIPDTTKETTTETTDETAFDTTEETTYPDIPLFVVERVVYNKENNRTAVNIQIVNNPGIASIGLSIHYDKEKMKLVDYKINQNLGGQTVQFNPNVSL